MTAESPGSPNHCGKLSTFNVSQSGANAGLCVWRTPPGIRQTSSFNRYNRSDPKDYYHFCGAGKPVLDHCRQPAWGVSMPGKVPSAIEIATYFSHLYRRVALDDSATGMVRLYIVEEVSALPEDRPCRSGEFETDRSGRGNFIGGAGSQSLSP